MTLLLTCVGVAMSLFVDPSLWWLFGAGAFLVGCVMWITASVNGDKIVLSISGARPATSEEHQMLVNVGHEMAIAAGIPMPSVYVIEDSSPNAFATGTDPRKGIVCVTTGLLEKLNRDELQGVVAHEIAHIKNGDILLMTRMALTVGLIVMLRDFLWRATWYGNRRSRSGSKDSSQGILMLVGMIFVVLAPLFATLLHFAVSRNREYLADATAAQLTRYPDGLADALQKISLDSEALEAANDGTAHMYIINPIHKSKLMNASGLFSTHPPTNERIRRLRSMGFKGHKQVDGSMPETPLRNDI
jgi:heat shock protein HtpX